MSEPDTRANRPPAAEPSDPSDPPGGDERVGNPASGGPAEGDAAEADPEIDPDAAADLDFDDDPGTFPVLGVLLDMGGVILDLGEAHGLPWGELARRGRRELLERVREAGGEADEDALEQWVFEPWRRGYARRRRVGREERWGPHLARLQRRAGTSGVSRGSLLEAWVRPYLDGLTPLSGAREALERLASAELRTALVSNVPLPGIFYRRVLEREGLEPFFEALLFSYDQRARKPGPILLQRALERLGVAPEEAVMVGDRRSTDIRAGRAAGVRTVWVESADRDGPEQDTTIGSIGELPTLLEIG